MAKDGVPARQLWQVPAFLIGLTALTTYLLVRPAWTSPHNRAQARLDRARRLWEKHDPHARKVVGLVQGFFELAGPDSSRAGEAHLIWGSTLARAARKLPAHDAVNLWKQSWEHLGKARELGVPDEDRPLLRATRGEAGFHVGYSPFWVQRWLSRSLDHADDRAEACRLLTQVCLRKNPPDYETALKANETLRQLPLVGEDVLGPARLQGGEILLQMRRPADARKLLEKISRDAPPELLARSRALRARTHQDEGHWTEAAALWQDMLDDRRRPLENAGQVYYQLGLCQRRLNQTDEAVKAWQAALIRGDAVIVSAAALGLVELLLPQGEPSLGELLARSVRGIRSPQEWNNPHVDLKHARELFEVTCQTLCQKKDHARTLDLIESYERLASPGRAAYLRGVTLRDWGLISLKGTAQDQQRGRELLRKAGAAFQTAAETSTDRAEQVERLWLAAEGHFQGGEAGRAVAVLERFLKLEGHSDDRLGEAWHRLALAQEALKNQAAAEAAHRRCISYRSRFAYRSRFRLAERELARGKKDVAGNMLVMNLTSLRLDHDDEALEKSLYTLGQLLFEGGKYAEVRPVLEEALAKFPSSPMQVRGRFDLAETYRRLADQENQHVVQGGNLTPEARDHFFKQHRHWLGRAAEQYQTLNQLVLTDTAAASALTQAEQVHISFSVADCRFSLGDYAAALKLYDELAERYRNRLERLSALGGTARCFAAQRDFARFQARLKEIRLALAGVDEQTRRQWEEWLNIASKGQ